MAQSEEFLENPGDNRLPILKGSNCCGKRRKGSGLITIFALRSGAACARRVERRRWSEAQAVTRRRVRCSAWRRIHRLRSRVMERAALENWTPSGLKMTFQWSSILESVKRMPPAWSV